MKKKNKKKQSASAYGQRLRDTVAGYVGVLGKSASRNAEAALAAEPTADTDDFEVSHQLLSVILERLVADMHNAKTIIEDQNLFLRSASSR